MQKGTSVIRWGKTWDCEKVQGKRVAVQEGGRLGHTEGSDVGGINTWGCCLSQEGLKCHSQLRKQQYSMDKLEFGLVSLSYVM